MIDSMKKLFVWDFHGTLEKGNELAALEISNLALARHGFSERLTAAQGDLLYGKKWYEYFAYILPDEPHDIHVTLQQTCFSWPHAEDIVAKYLRPNDHAPSVLQAIQESGHTQILISNTSVEALPIFVSQAKLSDFFNTDNAFAVMAHTKEVVRSKQDVLTEYIATAEKFEDIIVIGDTDKDMDMSRSVAGKGYFYSHPGKGTTVITTEPNIMHISDLREVLAEI